MGTENRRKFKVEVNKFGISIVAGFIFAVLLLCFATAIGSNTWSFSSSSSNPQYYKPNSFSSYSQSYASTYWPILSDSDKCKASTDFLMNIVPGSCTPSVVRSDLLEEQNVPVFCKIDVLKINPLVDVSQIKSVRFEGNFPAGVVGVSFHPNMEAVASQKGFLDKPLINDVGYVVVLLKRIEKEKDMPESIKINLTGVLRYDLEGFFGSGKSSFYLGVMDDANWSGSYKEYGIFKGAGYLKADWIDGDKAGISIYRDEDEKLVSFDLEKGKSSSVYYMPGFYCRAGVQLRLDDVKAAVKRVRLDVDDEKIWLVEGEKFLDNLCQVLKINEKKVEGKIERGVVIRCSGKSKELFEKVTEKEETEKEGLVDEEVSEDILKNFNQAKEYAEDIENFYGGVSSADGGFGEVWAAKAFYQLALLASKLEMKKTARDLFLKISENYPETTYGTEAELNLASITFDDTNYGEHNIKLIGIQVPSEAEASAVFSVVKNGNKILDKESVQEGEMFGENFKLINLYSDRVYMSYSYKDENGKNQAGKVYISYGESEKYGDYVVTLNKINLIETAKVSAIASMPNEYSKTNFSFAIGIEKRGIELSPEKTAEKIKNLENSIEKWEGIVNKLGSLVKGWKATCLATSTVLLVKNFLTNLGGGASARQAVMPAYYKKCEGEAGKDRAEFDACLKKYGKNIEEDIKIYQENIGKVNDEVLSSQKQHQDSAGNVDRKAVASELREKNFKEGLSYTQYVPDKQGNIISEEKKVEGEFLNRASLSDIRDLKLYRDISQNPGSSEIAVQDANVKIGEIINRLEKKGAEITYNPYIKESDNWLNVVRTSYYETGEQKGLAYVVPIPKSYTENGKTVSGFYAVVRDGGYTKGGE
ncbi:MAG: hypothetical protein AABX71_02890, partial [Nanoarchaeota archaeon]